MKHCSRCEMENLDSVEACKACGYAGLVYKAESVRVSPPVVDGDTTLYAVKPAFVATDTGGGDTSADGSNNRHVFHPSGYPNDGNPRFSDPPRPIQRMSLNNSTTGKRFMLRHWPKEKRYFVIGAIISICSIAIPFIYQYCESLPRPKVVFIEGLEGTSPEIMEGDRRRLTARLADKRIVPDQFIWSPPEMIEGEGQSVWLNPTSAYRRTQPYNIEVHVVAKDRHGNDCETVPPIPVTVVPKRLANRPPTLRERIYIDGGRQEVQAGGEVRLHALATDADNDEIKYSWAVNNNAVLIKENGRPEAILQIPSDVTRSNMILVNVRLTATDGYENGNVSDEVILTVTPRAVGRKAKGGGKKPQVMVVTVNPPHTQQPQKSVPTPTTGTPQASTPAPTAKPQAQETPQASPPKSASPVPPPELF